MLVGFRAVPGVQVLITHIVSVLERQKQSDHKAVGECVLVGFRAVSDVQQIDHKAVGECVLLGFRAVSDVQQIDHKAVSECVLLGFRAVYATN